MIINNKINKNNISSENEYKGLCTNCHNAPTCEFSGNSEKPVLQCEEYDCIKSDSSVDKHKDMNLINGICYENYSGHTEIQKYRSLCINCEDREICMYPKPEGEVWHCEEYK